MPTTNAVHGLDAEILLKAQELIHVGTWAWDVKADRVDWSDEMFRMFGVARGSIDLRLETYLSFVDAADRDRVTAIIAKALHDREPFRFDCRLEDRDGSPVFHHARGTVICDESGEPVRMLGTCLDITDRVLQEIALAESEERFRSIFEQSAIGMAVCQADGRFVNVNPTFAAFLGYTKEELLARSFVDVTHPEDVDLTRQRIIENGGRSSVTYEKRYVRKDGATVWARVTVTRMRHDDGSLNGYVGIVEDITERNRLQGQLLQAQKMEALGLLAGGVAHDFNNLLTVVSSCASFIQDTVGMDSPAIADLKEIIAATQHGAALTGQLLAFSRRQILKPEPVDVNAVLQVMTKTFSRLIGENIHLLVLPGARMATVDVDVHQLEQVVLNLVLNARDAIAGEGSITVQTSNRRIRAGNGSETDYVVISIIDDGSGIDPEHLPRIFEPFFTTKPVGRGTGLGLSTVHGIVEQSGGSISVESEPGRGTTIHVLLPGLLATPQIEQDHVANVLLHGSETVLLAEDEAPLRAVARRILTGYGYTVLEARHGEDAAQISARYPGRIDLLITDVVMPVLGGRELARLVRSQRPGIRVLYISGYTDDELLRKGILEPGARLLRKPFMPADLAASARELLHAGSA